MPRRSLRHDTNIMIITFVGSRNFGHWNGASCIMVIMKGRGIVVLQGRFLLDTEQRLVVVIVIRALVRVVMIGLVVDVIVGIQSCGNVDIIPRRRHALLWSTNCNVSRAVQWSVGETFADRNVSFDLVTSVIFKALLTEEINGSYGYRAGSQAKEKQDQTGPSAGDYHASMAER